jgi:hypothetical protein
MRSALAVGCTVLVMAGTASASPAPMTRADGEVCDLLRAQAKDRCQVIAQDGAATVYQSGARRAGIRRLVLAIDTGADVLVSPPIDVVTDQLASATPSLRTIARDDRRDDRPGVVLDVVATWKRGAPVAHREAHVRCARADAIWKCEVTDELVLPSPSRSVMPAAADVR